MLPIDYSQYSLDELGEALRAIDSTKYPENKAALDAELCKRKSTGEYAQEKEESLELAKKRLRNRIEFASRARSWVAIYVLGTLPLVVLDQAYLGLPPILGSSYTYLLIGTLYCVGLGLGAVGVLRKKTWGPLVLGTLLLIQTFYVQTENLYFEIVSFSKFYLTIPEPWAFGFETKIDPGIVLVYGSDGELSLGIDLLTIGFLWILYFAEIGHGE